MSQPFKHRLLLCLLLMAPSVCRAQDLDIDKLSDELLGIGKRVPECLTDGNGLPKRIIVTHSGAGLFEKPAKGAKRTRSLALYDRLYLYVEDTGTGFHRVGVDPWGEGPTGWIATPFCLVWDHNEMLFLNGDSIGDSVNRIHVWKTESAAQEGKAESAVFSENVEREKGAVGDVFFPVLGKNRSGTLYRIGFLFGGDQGARDQYGSPMSKSQKQSIARNTSILNLVLIVDATGSMSSFVKTVKARAGELVRSLQQDSLLKKLGSSEPFSLRVNFALVAYRDRGDAFDVKTFVGKTDSIAKINSGLSSLSADGGGDSPELVVAAIRHALSGFKFERGALNRIVLLGDAPPHELEEDILIGVGKEAQASFIQIDAIQCGGSEVTEAAFEQLASASGGRVYKIDNAGALSEQIAADLKARLAGAPVEQQLVQSSLQSGQSISETARNMGLDGGLTRRMTKLLVARGADVGGKAGVRTGWVRVRPGKASRFRLHVYISRWKLALQLSNLLNLTDKTTLAKNAEAAKLAVRRLLGFTAGEKSSAGLDKSGDSVRARGENVPELTATTKKGPQAVISHRPQIRTKVNRLMKYWRNSEAWEHDYIWIPIDVLP